MLRQLEHSIVGRSKMWTLWKHMRHVWSSAGAEQGLHNVENDDEEAEHEVDESGVGSPQRQQIEQSAHTHKPEGTLFTLGLWQNV